MSNNYKKNFDDKHEPDNGSWTTCANPECRKAIQPGRSNRENKLHRDHIMPKSVLKHIPDVVPNVLKDMAKGFIHSYDNLQPLCAECNQKKGNKIDERVAIGFFNKWFK